MANIRVFIELEPAMAKGLSSGVGEPDREDEAAATRSLPEYNRTGGNDDKALTV